MKTIIPEPKSLNRRHPIYRKRETESEQKAILLDPKSFAQQQRDFIDSKLGVSIHPRTPTKSGNISMYDHLNNIRNQFDEDVKYSGVLNPTGLTKKIVDRMSTQINTIIDRITPKVNWG